ncbi:TonB-dependent receptor plug domain-containing protein [Maribacter sp. TH_r10]|uniref:TonB-dependent receptor n=1 Tax=Maribacter sp. TH_r10 TaxID=3082086 RepID=UPI002952C1C0|nr:TonB-dependent receptor plug domain-containing protein [Maribacter sp. TH_r10]MDV7140323.1 TonB-dependent receptor plug domain-containing protein [Maribacter sp. TH_r10]
MPKVLHKPLLTIVICLLPFFFFQKIMAQENNAEPIRLTTAIHSIEKEYNIKFSYVDEDLKNIYIPPISSKELQDVLDHIQNHTQLKIKRLNERYYTISKTTTIDVCAKVLDNYKENTVTGSSVEVLGSDIALITDDQGQFHLKDIPRNSILQIKHIGFKPLFIAAEELMNHNPCKTLLLDLNYEQLNEVIVYQFLTTGLSKEMDASIQMTSKDFGILPGLIEPDVLQTIQALPGIESIDETVSNINIRGGTNDQNLILWDGIKMYQSGHFFGLISAFNPYLTDKVTLIKNGTSSQYGGGVSGVLDIESKNDITGDFYGGAGFNLINGDVYGEIPIADNAAFQFSARRSLTDFFDTPTYKQFFDRAFQDSQIIGDTGQTEEIKRTEDFYFYDFTGKFLFDINPAHKIRISFINIHNNLDYSEQDLSAPSETQSRLNQTNISFGGSLESEWNTVFSSKINTYYTRYNLDSEHTTINSPQLLSQENEVIETGLKANTFYKLSESLNWLNGYEFTETGILNFSDVTQPPYSNKIKGVMRTHVLFSEMEYTSPNTKLYARGGIRLNYNENLNTFSELRLEPRLNVNYEFADHLKIELQGEYKNQTTHQVVDLEQNFLGIEKRRWYIADPDNPLIPLPITKSKQGSIGLNYDHHSLYVGLEGFYKDVNGISARTQGFQSEGEFNEEIGGYTVKGLEFLINKKTKDYSSWLSYGYNVNDYHFNDIDPRKFPNNLDIRHTITFAGNYTYNQFKFGVGLNYRTGKPYTRPDAENPVDNNFFPSRIAFEKTNSSRLPEYLRADASAIYNFNLTPRIKATTGISVLNFINRKNILNRYYQINENDEIETIENVSLGLTPNISFRVTF